MHRHPLLACLALALLAPVAAQAESTQCTPVTSVPITVSAPGSYCLTGDLTSTVTGTDVAITIDADYVTLDLNGHSLVGPGSDTGGRGILALAHHDVHVRNGTVRGFSYGVWLLDKMGVGIPAPLGLSSRNEVADLLVEDTRYGIASIGTYARILRNRVLDVKAVGISASSNALSGGNGAIYVVGNEVVNLAAPAGSSATVLGISVGSPGSLIQDNAVTTLRGPSGSSAIYVWGAGSAVARNRETDLGGAWAVNCSTTTPPSRVEGNLWVGTGSLPVTGCSLVGDNW